MRLKTMLLPALHTVCIGAVLLLAGVVVREKWGDCEADVLREARSALDTCLPGVRLIYQKNLAIVERNTADYHRGKDWPQRAKKIRALADSMFVLLESLEQKPDSGLVYEAQDELRVFRFKAWELTNFDPMGEAVLPKSWPPGWLIQSWKHDSPEVFAIMLAQAQVDIGLIESGIMNLLREKAHRPHICIDFRYHFWPNQLSPKAGDLVQANVLLSKPLDPPDSLTFRLNRKVLHAKKNTAKFSVRHDKPGNYPLHFSIEQRDRLTDSVRITEKTYWLRVRE